MKIDYIVDTDGNSVFYDDITTYDFTNSNILFGHKKVTSNDYILIQHNNATEYRFNTRTGAFTSPSNVAAPGSVSVNNIDTEHVELQCAGYVQNIKYLSTFEYVNNIDLSPDIRINDIVNIEDTALSLNFITLSRHVEDEQVITNYRAYYGNKNIKFDGTKLIDVINGNEVDSYKCLLIVYNSNGTIVNVSPQDITATTYINIRGTIANFRPGMVKLLDVSKSPVYQVINLNNIDGGADTDNLKMAMLHNKVDDYIERW